MRKVIPAQSINTIHPPLSNVELVNTVNGANDFEIERDISQYEVWVWVWETQIFDQHPSVSHVAPPYPRVSLQLKQLSTCFNFSPVPGGISRLLSSGGPVAVNSFRSLLSQIRLATFDRLSVVVVRACRSSYSEV